MNSEYYIDKSGKTCLGAEQMQLEVVDNIDEENGNLMHAALGIAGESGEIVDLIKKKIKTLGLGKGKNKKKK